MVQIRAYEPEDAHAVASVILPIQQAEFGIPITLDDQPDLRDIGGFYQKGSGNFWVARLNGQTVGTIALLDIGNRDAALRKMFVAAPYRGPAFGVAKHLLRELLAWSARQALRNIYLGTTAKFLAAHKFYEKNCFVEVDKSSLPEAFPVMAVDSKFYRLSLAANAA
jgi:N-acetylglutamate synthase-like GNAT family acetyltransferase